MCISESDKEQIADDLHLGDQVKRERERSKKGGGGWLRSLKSDKKIGENEMVRSRNEMKMMALPGSMAFDNFPDFRVRDHLDHDGGKMDIMRKKINDDCLLNEFSSFILMIVLTLALILVLLMYQKGAHFMRGCNKDHREV